MKDDFKKECMDIFTEQFGPDEPVEEGIGAFVASSMQVTGWTMGFCSIFVSGLVGLQLFAMGLLIFIYGYLVKAFVKSGSDAFVHQMLQNKAFRQYITKEGRKEFASIKKMYKQATTKLPSHIIAALDGHEERWAEWVDLSTDDVSLYEIMAHYDIDIHLVTEDMHFSFLGDTTHIQRVVLVCYDADTDRILFKNIRTPNKGEIEGFFKD